MKQLSLDECLKALDKMKRSRRDRIGMLGELGIAGLGVAAGWVVAAIIGAKTLAIFGLIIVIAAAPMREVIAAAVAGGGLAYGLTKLVRSGSKYDTLKNMNIRELEQRIEQLKQQSNHSWRREPKMRDIITSVQLLVANQRMSSQQALDFIAAIEKKHTSISGAFEQIQQLLNEKTSR